MKIAPISPRVNSPKNDDAELIKPLSDLVGVKGIPRLRRLLDDRPARAVTGLKAKITGNK
jgi:hypothetical protein